MGVVKLSREYKFGAKKVNEINLDFEELSALDFMTAEKEYKMRNKASTVKELEDGWALTVAATASGFKYGDLVKLKGSDYLKVINTTKLFLNAGLVSEEITSNTEIEETEAQEADTAEEE